MKNVMEVAVLQGDSIGQEIVPQAVKMLRALERGGLSFDLTPGLIGGAAVPTGEAPLPQRTPDLARGSDAILFGAVGGYANDKLPRLQRAGLDLLQLRKELTLIDNFRPAVLFPELIGASGLRPEIVEGMDMIILRELNGGLYFGEPRGISALDTGERVGINTMRYTECEIERVAHAGFRMAQKRRNKLCSVHKANVLETMALWREVVTRVGRGYPGVTLTHLDFDTCAMQLLRDPLQFDVIVTGNVFGDILSDEAALLTGSIGMLPSASLGEGTLGLYEPVDGSAPDIAWQDKANPLATILSASMMLRHSFGLDEAADRVETAVRRVLAELHRRHPAARHNAAGHRGHGRCRGQRAALMVRLRHLSRADLAPTDQDLLKRPINLHRQLAHSPSMARAFFGLGHYIRHGSPLDPRLWDLAILQVGWLARAPYEWSHNVKIGCDFGVTEADIHALIADTAGQETSLGPAERAVLEAARHLTTEAALTDKQFAALRAHLDDTGLVDLLLTIVFHNGVVRVLSALQIDVEPDYQRYLDAFTPSVS